MVLRLRVEVIVRGLSPVRDGRFDQGFQIRDDILGFVLGLDDCFPVFFADIGLASGWERESLSRAAGGRFAPSSLPSP